jgi:CspA family cold shock protein
MGTARSRKTGRHACNSGAIRPGFAKGHDCNAGHASLYRWHSRLACLVVSPAKGLSQEHAKSGLDRANGSHGHKTLYAFQMEAIMAQGTVKFFNAQKGFGFIVQDAGGPDVFVHISAVERAGMSNLNEGQKLSFDIEADRRSGKSAATNLQSI